MLEGIEHAFLGNEMEVTAWYRFNKLADKYVFNHVSDGYNESQEAPKVVSEFQSLAWNNAKWMKYRAVIQDGVLKEKEPDDK